MSDTRKLGVAFAAAFASADFAAVLVVALGAVFTAALAGD